MCSNLSFVDYISTLQAQNRPTSWYLKVKNNAKTSEKLQKISKRQQKRLFD